MWTRLLTLRSLQLKIGTTPRTRQRSSIPQMLKSFKWWTTTYAVIPSVHPQLDGISLAMETLDRMTFSWPVAPESPEFNRIVKQVLYSPYQKTIKAIHVSSANLCLKQVDFVIVPPDTEHPTACANAYPQLHQMSS